jgi:steroid delta-isomerase-like uncharacterized protein
MRLWEEAWTRHDAAALASLYREDAVNHQVAAGAPAVGRAAILADLGAFFAAFPDSYTRVETLLVDGDRAAVEWSGGGTWLGEFLGRRPNGKAFALRGCGFFVISDGLIAFQRGYWDKATWFGQLGIPPDGV